MHKCIRLKLRLRLKNEFLPAPYTVKIPLVLMMDTIKLNLWIETDETITAITPFFKLPNVGQCSSIAFVTDFSKKC